MRNAGGFLGLGFLTLVAAAAIAAPWLPLRDPAAQPDGLVLRDLPPFARVPTVHLANGEVRYADEIRIRMAGARAAAPDGLEIRRGAEWTRIPATELAAGVALQSVSASRFVLGTDGYGRDLLSRLVHGARVSLLVGFLAAALAVGLGSAVGLAAGVGGALLDALLMRIADVFLSIPRIFLLVLLVALYGRSLTGTILVLSATTWMAAAKVVRAEVLSQRERDFVRAARAAGSSAPRLAIVHLLPAVATPLLVEASLRVANTILLESSLSFLGLGVPPPVASWGSLVADGRDSLLSAWWISTLPGIAVAVTVFAVTALAESLRRRVSPRLATVDTN
jgi:peptide/nickel transport system permease protein